MTFLETPMSRRDFLIRGATVLLALPTGISAAEVASRAKYDQEDDDNRKLIEAIGNHRLYDTSPEEILRAFYGAPTGTLMSYYQLFWPIFIRPDQIQQRVQDLRELCAHQNKSEYPKWHRIRVLPAVAAAHALGLTIGEDAEEFRSLIALTHRSAFELDKSPNREVLEIIWQNMTAALIRNHGNWHVFIAGSELIDLGEAVCHRFLDREIILIHAAAAAWQFFLTYERALLGRRRQYAAAERAKVQAACERIRRHTSFYLPWLVVLERLYKNRNGYSKMLPQLTEVVMRRQSISELTPSDRDAVNFFILMRLQSTHNNYQIANKEISSPYMQEPLRAEEVTKGSLTFLSNYGVKQSDWEKLKRLVGKYDVSIANDTVDYLNGIFHEREYGKIFQQSDFEKKDSIWRAKWIPFRECDEEEVFRVMQPNHSWDYVSGAVAATTAAVSTRDQLIDFWRKPAEFVAMRESKKRPDVLQIKDTMVKMEAELPPLAARYEEDWGFVRESIQDASTSKIVITGISNRSREAGMAEYPAEKGETAMQPEEKQHRLPGSRIVKRVDIGKLFASAVRFAQTATTEDVTETLRRAKEEYFRRDPHNVPPFEDE